MNLPDFFTPIQQRINSGIERIFIDAEYDQKALPEQISLSQEDIDRLKSTPHPRANDTMMDYLLENNMVYWLTGKKIEVIASV